MGNGMNKVLPGLYVGNYRDSKDTQQLDKYKITHIVAIHDSPRRLLPDKHYLCVMAADTPDQNLSQYFAVCNDFIHAARLREGNVLIHCLAGMSRSVTMAVAYIMTATNLSWKDALKVVRAGRSVANPNVGFQTQLQEFEMYRLAEERKRLRERFPSTALEQLDRSKCLIALNYYEELLQNRHICEGNCAKGEKCPTGVCNVDPNKGLFRRRPSTTSTRSRVKPQTSVSNSSLAATAQSCPTTPKHVASSTSSTSTSMALLGADHSIGSRRSLDNQRIAEDDENHPSPSTSLEAAEYAAAIEASRLEQQQRQLNKKSPTRTPIKSHLPRTSRTNITTNVNRSVHLATQDDRIKDQNKLSNYPITAPSSSFSPASHTSLQRCPSTVSGLGVRPRSSPGGLYSYTGSVPTTVHGSRVDLPDYEKGSAIYLGCSAPRNSTLSLAAISTKISTTPNSPARSPPVSPKKGVRRSTSLIKKSS